MALLEQEKPQQVQVEIRSNYVVNPADPAEELTFMPHPVYTSSADSITASLNQMHEVESIESIMKVLPAITKSD